MSYEGVDERFYETLGPLPLSEILSGIDVTINDTHSLSRAVSLVSSLQNVEAGALVFVENRKHLPLLKHSQAFACFVKPAHADLVASYNIIPILTKTPRAHFARVLGKLFREKPEAPVLRSGPNASGSQIHPTAIIANDAEIGADVKIGPYAVIGTGVRIGDRCIIGAHTNISFALLGEACVIKPGAVIGGSGFGVAHDENGVVDIPHLGRVILRDRVSIGSQSCVDRGQLGDTEIGDDTKIDNLVQIAHNVKIGKGSAIAGHTGVSGSCIIGDYVQMGGSVGLADHVKIGDRVMIGARSGVMHDIPDGETWLGTPAQPFRDEMRMVSRLRKLGANSAKKE